eukprot:CAMPEP_0198430646 /NCGR_PEP_ID=MMETSP1452-20131203/14739_1 /TAXON_ID=1181717 /ORGANISM="Synchroma pusillum, Strain CCMP3072" /LENGTH=119 /DNA_ID=CAMNT_0044151087 /DNA_START=33 /DNA_END=392 /DNA_ORIENTATION=-
MAAMGQPPGAEGLSNQERIVFSTEKYMANTKAVDFVRSTMFIVAGVIAGILGCTSSQGAFLYLGFQLFTNLGLAASMGFATKDYVNKTLVGFCLSDLTKNGLAFVLWWTVSYGLVHIYT